MRRVLPLTLLVVLAPSTTAGSPGGVIGKVLGGVRVEEVFLDSGDTPARWRLRTPKGIFLLKPPEGDRPLASTDFEEVRWGDGEHQLVGRSAFGPGQPNRVVGYAVPRLPSSIEVVHEDSADGPAVRLLPIASWTLPREGVDLGARVDLSHAIDYRQQNVEYDRTVVYQWRVPFPGVPGFYDLTDVEVTPPRTRTLTSRTVTFGDAFAVVLDSTHYDLRQSPTEGATYSWTLTDVSASTSGHLLAVVRVDHAPPAFFRWPRVAQPVYGLDGDGNPVVLETCGAFVCLPLTVPLMRTFPEGLLLWAVVDLTDGRVLAKTADDQIAITVHVAEEAPSWATPTRSPTPVVYRHTFERRQGKPDAPDSTTDLGWGGEFLRTWDAGAFATQTELTLNVGAAEAVAGWLRAELQLGLRQLGFLQATPGAGPATATFAFGDPGPTQMTLRVTTPASPGISLGAFLDEAVRARPAPGAERLVFVGDGIVVGQGEWSGVLVWDAPNGPATGLLALPVGPESGRLSLGSATSKVAVVSDFARAGGYVVPLDGTGAPRFVPDPDGLFFLEVLAPRYLYDVRRERFVRPVVGSDGVLLQATALPRVLRDGPGGPIGDYHAIRLP